MNNSTIIQKLTSRVWRDRLSGYKQLEEIKTPNGWINLLKEIPDNNPILIDSLVSHLIKFFSESERSDSSTLALFTFSSSSPFWPNLNAYKNLSLIHI